MIQIIFSSSIVPLHDLGSRKIPNKVYPHLIPRSCIYLNSGITIQLLKGILYKLSLYVNLILFSENLGKYTC